MWVHGEWLRKCGKRERNKNKGKTGKATHHHESNQIAPRIWPPEDPLQSR